MNVLPVKSLAASPLSHFLRSMLLVPDGHMFEGLGTGPSRVSDGDRVCFLSVTPSTLSRIGDGVSEAISVRLSIKAGEGRFVLGTWVRDLKM